MLKSPRSKGVRLEARTKALLESQGFVVTTSKNNSRFCKEKDYFNLFDCVAVSERQVLFVQVKCNYVLPAVKNDIGAWALRFKQHCAIYCWKDRVKEPVIYDLNFTRVD